MLREADTGWNITELCRRKNISEATLHRWKREFGMMEINEARRPNYFHPPAEGRRSPIGAGDGQTQSTTSTLDHCPDCR